MGRTQSLTDLTPEGLETIGGDGPTPELAAQLAEEYQRLMEQLGDSSLQRVATFKLEGYTNEEIADRLVISPLTAKTHVRNVLRKLDCHDRAALVALAYETQLIKPRET